MPVQAIMDFFQLAKTDTRPRRQSRTMGAPYFVCAWVLVFAIGLFPGILLSKTVFVHNPATRLLSAASMQASGPSLQKGASLQVLNQQGLFYKVRSSQGTGWVPRLFVGNSRPGSRVNFGNSLSRNTAVKARARAASFSQTAAARGFSSSENVRARGEHQDFDFQAILWIEKLAVSKEELENFQKSGQVK